MKQFFKYTLASMLGFFLAYILIIIIGIAILAGLVAVVGTEKAEKLESNSVLHIKLDYDIPERTSNNPLEGFDFSSLKTQKHIGLNDIIASIEAAKTEDNIKGIYLDLDFIPSGLAMMEEIRNALLDFKTSGKFIYAYSEFYSQRAYYLASVADKVYLNPMGIMDFRGMSAEMMFFKGTFDKLEIEPQVIRQGKYKSAAESFYLDKLSAENRVQLRELIESIWSNLLTGISASRNIPVAELREISNQLKVQNAKDALEYKMIDSLTYIDGVHTLLRNTLGLEEKDKIRFVKISRYAANVSDDNAKNISRSKIAVIYASGAIGGGEGNENTIGSDRIGEAIRKARKDDNIKAIVLRINSPGGSALASEVIWRETELAKKVKPVIASMSDVAASGGYYIACAADTIIAQPNTITGSIGVIGLMINAKKFLNNKLGITVDTVKTGMYSDFPTAARPLTPSEKLIFEKFVGETYDTFLQRVSDGRKLTKEYVDSVGQGRVWTGTDARRLKLIDATGSLKDAIEIAARMSGTEKYKIVSLPEQKDPLMQILEDISGDAQLYFTKKKIGEENFKYIEKAGNILQWQGVQVRMPFEFELN